MSDPKKPKFDPLNPPKDMTPKQVARWLAVGRKVFAQNQAAEQAAAEAKAKAEAAAEARAARISLLRSQIKISKPTVGGAAKFLFMPQFNLSMQGISFALTLLVRHIAQSLASAGLLAPDHPALSYEGAKIFKLFPLLEEARLNLMPLRLLRENLSQRGTSSTGFSAVQQYAVFASTVGFLVIGCVGLAGGLFHLVFGAAHAFAQNPPASQPPTTGTGIGGGFSFTPGPGADMGSAVVDWIFGTGSSTTSLASSGLGGMLALYSNAILIFAGVCVLWIIISAVAETARTGIPLGKQFNHIWAPIRLVIALGLLVPLGSGLNSGQYIALYLAKWGSKQATSVWSAFATQMITPVSVGSTPPNGTSAATNVTMDLTQNRAMARELFQVALCQQVYNQYNNTNGVQQQNIGFVQQAPTGANIGANGLNIYGLPAAVATTVPDQIAWQLTQSQGGNPSKVIVNCGSLTIPTPSATIGNLDAANTAKTALATSQASAVSSYLNNISPLVQQLTTSAIFGTSGTVMLDQSTFNTLYQNAVDGYTATLANNIATNVIPSYNNNLSQNMAANAQQYGWMTAPQWIIEVAQQNGVLGDAVQMIPTVQMPDASTLDSSTGSVFSVAQQLFQTMAPPNQTENSTTAQKTAFSIVNALQQLTNGIGTNPMGKFGYYGRELLSTGFEIITPPNLIDCYQDPFKNPDQCQFVFTEALMQAQQTGGWHGLNASQVEQMIKDRNYNSSSNYTGSSGGIAGMNYSYAGQALGGGTILPDNTAAMAEFQKITAAAGGIGSSSRAILYPVGMIMISFGFMAYILVLIPYIRYMLGELGWFIMLFETVLAMPLMSLALLRTEGEGLFPQQTQTNIVMLAAVILRPVFMVFGLVMALISFNAIMQVVNMTFAPTVGNLDPTGTDRSYLSMGVYIIIYGTLCYTLANSAFKMIDMLPNFVMSWLGHRGESRVDDASMVQQQAQGYMQTMAYSMRQDPGLNTAYGRQQQAQAETAYGGGATGQGQAASGGASSTGQQAAGLAGHQPSYQATQSTVQALTGSQNPVYKPGFTGNTENTTGTAAADKKGNTSL